MSVSLSVMAAMAAKKDLSEYKVPFDFFKSVKFFLTGNIPIDVSVLNVLKNYFALYLNLF